MRPGGKSNGVSPFFEIPILSFEARELGSRIVLCGASRRGAVVSKSAFIAHAAFGGRAMASNDAIGGLREKKSLSSTPAFAGFAMCSARAR